MARVFAFLMQHGITLEDEVIFGDTSDRIQTALQTVHNQNESTRHIARTAFDLALDKLI